jgi:flagellar motor component MotA
MEWLAGIPEILAILCGCAAAIAGALWCARHIGAGRFLAALIPPSATPPALDIERLAALAGAAREEGILSVESRLAGSGDAILEHGVRLLVEGTPRARLRRELEIVLDRRIASETRAGGGRWTRVMHLAVLAAAIAGLVASWRVGTTAPGLAPGVAAFLACMASLLGLAFVGPLCDRAFAVAGSGVAFSGLLSLETVMLMADRADAAAVRARLSALLPSGGSEAGALMAA